MGRKGLYFSINEEKKEFETRLGRQCVLLTMYVF